MSQHARIEELSDSDSDPPEDDLNSFVESDILRPTSSITSSNTSRPPKPPASRPTRDQATIQHPTRPHTDANFNPSAPPEYKTFQCIYPIYFDASRSRAEGRRVGKELAVPNPLAREIVDAAQSLGLKVVFEPGKLHPRDWSNPGRIRVNLKEASGARVKNKHHLYNLIAAHLKKNPTTESSPLRLRIQGMPMPDGPLPPPAVPKGWKINTILPLHSPAVSGGGVSENILKDMMQEMQSSGQAPALPGMMGDAGGDHGSGGGGQGSGKRKREGGKKK